MLEGTGLVKRTIKLNESEKNEHPYQRRGTKNRNSEFKAKNLESPRVSDHLSMFSEDNYLKYDISGNRRAKRDRLNKTVKLGLNKKSFNETDIHAKTINNRNKREKSISHTNSLRKFNKKGMSREQS
mmetsp:Transcript_13087/g.11566  ORF Transcript_13087/g.11566 Transcript_13087/m.11566 type:complete len:127 (+) Transcript_13087:57-437(+)